MFCLSENKMDISNYIRKLVQSTNKEGSLNLLFFLPARKNLYLKIIYFVIFFILLLLPSINSSICLFIGKINFFSFQDAQIIL